MIYFQLFFEFFKVGLFSIGGGLATIPFLFDLAQRSGWYTIEEAAQMIAVAESTPGPVGINMATYIGYKVAGPVGGIIATLGEVVPSFMIIVAVFLILEKFKENPLSAQAFYGIRAASIGLITGAVLTLASKTLWNVPLYQVSGLLKDLFQIKPLILIGLLLIAMKKWKLHPIVYLMISAGIGIVFKF